MAEEWGRQESIGAGGQSADPSAELRQQLTHGLLYTHSRLSNYSHRTLEGLSFLYAMIELLSEQGLLDVDALDARRQVVGERLSRQFKDSGQGALFQDPEYDKYDFADGAGVDCASRIDLCKAACCRLPFALSKQDIREGIIRWDLGQPYLIDQGKDGYCNHMDRCTGRCTVYEQRPVPCRGFDCRTDNRVWLDFDRGVINPEIERADWPHCLVSDQTALGAA
jgi:hypothetical protein